MKRIISLCLLLSGCALIEPKLTLPQAQQLCSTGSFATLGECIEDQLDHGNPKWRADPNADLADVYVAWLKAAGSRVAAHTMSEEDARLGAALMVSRIKADAAQRRAAAAADQQARFNAALAGLALMQAAQPQPLPATSAPSGPITCTTYQPNSVTGQVQTVCR